MIAHRSFVKEFQKLVPKLLFSFIAFIFPRYFFLSALGSLFHTTNLDILDPSHIPLRKLVFISSDIREHPPMTPDVSQGWTFRCFVSSFLPLM